MDAMVLPVSSRKKNSKAEVIDWQLPSACNSICNGQIHIWRINLDASNLNAETLSVLSSDELARADRIVIPKKRQRFLAGRVSLREIIALYIENPAGKIEFKYLQNGKPVLADTEFANRFQFNISHSEHWMVMAITAKMPVGIDIEMIRGVSAKSWTIKHHFSERDREAFRNLNESFQDREFIAAWTMKEATAKTTGDGLALSNKNTHFFGDQNSSLTTGQFKIFEKQPFWCIRFVPVAGYFGVAAAKMSEKPGVVFWDFKLAKPQIPS